MFSLLKRYFKVAIMVSLSDWFNQNAIKTLFRDVLRGERKVKKQLKHNPKISLLIMLEPKSNQNATPKIIFVLLAHIVIFGKI